MLGKIIPVGDVVFSWIIQIYLFMLSRALPLGPVTSSGTYETP